MKCLAFLLLLPTFLCASQTNVTGNQDDLLNSPCPNRSSGIQKGFVTPAGGFHNLANSPVLVPSDTIIPSGESIVASVAALRALTSMTNGQYVVTAGYYSANDGGGGTFVYDSSSSTTPDNGLVLVPNSGSGRFLRLYSGEIQAAWYGLHYDFSFTPPNTIFGTDNTSVIQAAINNNEGKTIALPPGIFRIVGTITISGQGTVLKGAGCGAGRKYGTVGQFGGAPYTGTCLMGAGGGQTVIQFDDTATLARVQDVAIIWPNTGASNSSNVGIAFNGDNGSTVQDVMIANDRLATGVYLPGGSKESINMNFNRLWTQNLYTGVYVPYDNVYNAPSSFCKFSQCVFQDYIGLHFGGYVTVTDCDFEGSAISLMDDYDKTYSDSKATARISATNCYFELTKIGSFPYNSALGGQNNLNLLAGLVGTTVSITASGTQATFTIFGGSWPVASIQPGQLIYIPAGSEFSGTSNSNTGYYVLSNGYATHPTKTTFTAYKWLEVGGSVLANNPVNVSRTAVAATTDIQHIVMAADFIMNGNTHDNFNDCTFDVYTTENSPRSIVGTGAGGVANIFGGSLADAVTAVGNSRIYIYGANENFIGGGSSTFTADTGRVYHINCSSEATEAGLYVDSKVPAHLVTGSNLESVHLLTVAPPTGSAKP